MKRLSFIPAALVLSFIPVFALQAEKLSEPLPLPKVLSSANAEIAPSDPKLRSTLLAVRVPETAQKGKYRLSASCGTVGKPVWSSVSSSGIRTELVPATFSGECGTSVSVFFLSGSEKVPNSEIRVPVITKESLFVELSDLSDENLFLYARETDDASKRSGVSSLSGVTASDASVSERFAALSLSYRSSALAFRSKAAYSISRSREDFRYLVPVAGKPLPTDYPFIPGSARPYRKDVTDGIHHGWDLMAPVGTPVRAVGEGVVIRVVSGFAWKDFERIEKRPKSSDDLLRNLDVYRGNQVWLKTADGNVTFYSHLRDIAPGISEGVSVRAGEMLGTVGVSGVPDRAYKNPHLHFEIQKNPHDGSDSKDPLSVMRWGWLAKGMKKSEAVSLAEKAFAR